MIEPETAVINNSSSVDPCDSHVKAESADVIAQVYIYVTSLYQDTSINKTLSSVPDVTFVYITSEMRTPHLFSTLVYLLVYTF